MAKWAKSNDGSWVAADKGHEARVWKTERSGWHVAIDEKTKYAGLPTLREAKCRAESYMENVFSN